MNRAFFRTDLKVHNKKHFTFNSLGSWELTRELKKISEEMNFFANFEKDTSLQEAE